MAKPTARTEFRTYYRSRSGLTETRVAFCRGGWAGMWAVAAYSRSRTEQRRWKTLGHIGPFVQREQAEVSAERLLLMLLKVRR